MDASFCLQSSALSAQLASWRFSIRRAPESAQRGNAFRRVLFNQIADTIFCQFMIENYGGKEDLVADRTSLAVTHEFNWK